MSIKNILISQQEPKNLAPYEDLSSKYGVNFSFIPFFVIKPLGSKEFRMQRINILDYSAIIFSARSTIDAFFSICDELRIKIPETMKYFCTTEIVAMYLQKHIVFRKRKIFFGDGTPSSIINQIGTKHKNEKFLIATSESASTSVANAFIEAKLDFDSAVFVKSEAQDLTHINLSEYDITVMYNVADIKSLYHNYPSFEQNNLKICSFGRSVVNAIDEVGLKIDIMAPTPEAPSVAKALDLYLANQI